MTKVNILKALEQAEQDSVPPFEVRCNRGQRFSRYKKHGFDLPSEYWAHKYFQAGGFVDSFGVWGYSPLDLALLEKSSIDPEYLGELVKLHGRVDYDGEYILDMIHLGLRPRTIQEFHRNARGIRWMGKLNKLGIQSNRGVISLGWMSEEKFVDFVGRRLTKCSREAVIFFLSYPFKDTSRFSRHAIKAIRDGEKSRKRHCLYVPSKDYVYATKDALIAHIVHRKTALRNWSGPFMHMLSTHTSVGQVTYGQDGGIDMSRQGYLFRYNYNNDRFEMEIARRIENVWVIKIKGITFAWADSFNDHIEGTSVKDAIEKLQKRIKKASLVLTLNDVRNDRSGTAGYCLTGVKDFARNRMPFLYRLIAPFQTWADVPVEIMATEFSLANKDIFQGYRNPVG